MTIVVFTTPTTEPLTVAEVVEQAQLDATNQELPPSAQTAALAGTPVAGNVDNGAHRYLCTFVTSSGETQAGTPTSVVTVADKTVNGRVELTAIPIGGSLVTSRKIYRTVAGGSTYLLLATIANNTATAYTDNIADAALGAGAPSTNTTADPLIGRLIRTARQRAEHILGRALITQTQDAYFDHFPRGSKRHFELPPLSSVTSIVYTDIDGVEQTLSASAYQVDSKRIPARIDEAYSVVWPSTREQLNAVRIRFVCGYGSAADVPDCVKDWMLIQIRTMWENRAQFAVGIGSLKLIEAPTSFVDGLLDSERVY